MNDQFTQFHFLDTNEPGIVNADQLPERTQPPGTTGLDHIQKKPPGKVPAPVILVGQVSNAAPGNTLLPPLPHFNIHFSEHMAEMLHHVVLTASTVRHR